MDTRTNISTKVGSQCTLSFWYISCHCLSEKGYADQSPYAASDDIARNKLWRRTVTAFDYGDVLITLGTGKLTPNEEEGLGLAGEHDYAVINMREIEGQKLFLVKNPWSEGTVWKGHIHCSSDAVGNAQRSQDLCIPEMPVTRTFDTESLAPGTFWMGLNDIFQSFESLYLNWNPGLFSHREDIHFKWNLSGSSNPDGSLVTNPQYKVCSSIGGTVWILLSRHFISRDDKSDKGKSPPNCNTVDCGYISLHGFDSDGERVFSSDEAAVHGPYVDSPNTLLKLELPAGKASTVVVCGQGLPRSINTFTLSTFSFGKLSLVEALDKYTHTVLQHGVWTSLTAGGNATSLSYHTNPQFSLQLAVTSKVAILLENTCERHPIHVKLVWANGQQICSIKTRDVVADSGEYRKGYAFVEIQDAQSGVYTIVCSTFEQGQLGKFTLRVSSTSACAVNSIPVAKAGRFATNVQSRLFAPGSKYLSAPLVSHRLNRVSVSARLCVEHSSSNKSKRAYLKLGIHHGRPPLMTAVAVSRDDGLANGPSEIWIRDVDIEPSMCEIRGLWLVLERLESSMPLTAEYVDIDVFSDGPINVGDWT